jgi:hypothetical protein
MMVLFIFVSKMYTQVAARFAICCLLFPVFRFVGSMAGVLRKKVQLLYLNVGGVRQRPGSGVSTAI